MMVRGSICIWMIWTDVVRRGWPPLAGGLVDKSRAIPASPITTKLPDQSPFVAFQIAIEPAINRLARRAGAEPAGLL
jgi:hypothetical protein